MQSNGRSMYGIVGMIKRTIDTFQGLFDKGLSQWNFHHLRNVQVNLVKTYVERMRTSQNAAIDEGTITSHCLMEIFGW